MHLLDKLQSKAVGTQPKISRRGQAYKTSLPVWANKESKMDEVNLNDLDSRLQALEKRVYGERVQTNKPVKVNARR